MLSFLQVQFVLFIFRYAPMEATKMPPVEKLRRAETHLEAPALGGTFIEILRNGDDFRGNPKQMDEANKIPGGIEVGRLMPSAAAEARAFSERELGALLDGLTSEERAQLDVIVVASDSALGSLATPDGSTPPPRQRCVETAACLLEGIEKTMKDRGVGSGQLLNLKFHKDKADAQPLTLHRIEDLQMRPGTEEYFAFLKAKAKETGANMWVLYEEDTFKEERERLGAEGPQEISSRMQKFIDRAKEMARLQHKRTPDRRLLVLAVAPRDVVGPWLNIQVAGLPPEGHEVPRIDNLAGFGVAIAPDGEATIKVGDKESRL